jgi:hypothetical protein
MPITTGDQNPPDDEVVVGGKVGNPFPLPFPFEPPLLLEPPLLEPPLFEDPEGVGDEDEAVPPITVNAAPAELSSPS